MHDNIIMGIEDLDNLTGGFAPGELIVIAGRPGVGKTSFALNLARQLGETKTPSLFFNIAQSNEAFTSRLLCCQAGISSHRFTSKDVPALEAAQSAIALPGAFLMDSARQNMAGITLYTEARVRHDGIRLVLIDYLELVEGQEVLTQLKVLARECNIPILVLTQARRIDRQDDRPRLSDLADGVEEHADMVILLRTPHYEDQPRDDALDVIVAKHRNGPTGDVTLLFNKATGRMKTFDYAALAEG